MKKVNFIFILLTSLTFAQSPLEFEKVIETNETKEKTFPKIKEWIATKFVSANDVIQMEDLSSGIFVVKGKSSYEHPKALYNCYNGAIEFTLKIEVRDNRFKFQLFDLKHITNYDNKCDLGQLTTAEIHSTKGVNKGYNNRVWKLLQEEAFELASRVTSGLETVISMNNSADDWK